MIEHGLFAKFEETVSLESIINWKKMDLDNVAEELFTTLIETDGRAPLYAMQIVAEPGCLRYLHSPMKELVPEFCRKVMEIKEETPNFIAAVEEYPMLVPLMGHIMVAAAEAAKHFKTIQSN